MSAVSQLKIEQVCEGLEILPPPRMIVGAKFTDERVWEESIVWVDAYFKEITLIVAELVGRMNFRDFEDLKQHAYLTAFTLIRKFLDGGEIHNYSKYFLKTFHYQFISNYCSPYIEDYMSIEKVPDCRPNPLQIIEEEEIQIENLVKVADCKEILTKKQSAFVDLFINAKPGLTYKQRVKLAGGSDRYFYMNSVILKKILDKRKAS